jgi:hypothetical protein
VSDHETNVVDQTGQLFILPEDDSKASPIPDLPVRYIASSDEQIVTSGKADACDRTQLLNDRREGKCVVSYETSGGWVAISKSLLTDVLGAGQDAKIAGLPPEAAGVLKLMCRDLVASGE